ARTAVAAEEMDPPPVRLVAAAVDLVVAEVVADVGCRLAGRRAILGARGERKGEGQGHDDRTHLVASFAGSCWTRCSTRVARRRSVLLDSARAAGVLGSPRDATARSGESER